MTITDLEWREVNVPVGVRRTMAKYTFDFLGLNVGGKGVPLVLGYWFLHLHIWVIRELCRDLLRRTEISRGHPEPNYGVGTNRRKGRVGTKDELLNKKDFCEELCGENVLKSRVVVKTLWVELWTLLSNSGETLRQLLVPSRRLFSFIISILL